MLQSPLWTVPTIKQVQPIIAKEITYNKVEARKVDERPLKVFTGHVCWRYSKAIAYHAVATAIATPDISDDNVWFYFHILWLVLLSEPI